MTQPDLLDTHFYADIDGMHEAFRAMRAQGPVWRDEKNELWAVVQHAPLVDVERSAAVFSSSGCYRSRVAPQEEDMIAKDDPAHHEQRALVSRRFTPKAVQRLERAIDATVRDLVDGFIDDGELEVVDDLAAPFPARLTAHILGFGEDRAASVRSWSERLMRIDQLLDGPSVMMGMMTAIQEFAADAVQQGDRVILLYPSANRDESVFDDPYTFDIERDPNPHVSFGFGPHFCIGASLARLELRVLFTHLTRRITNLRVLAEPDIEPNIFVGAVRSFRLGFDRR